MSTHDVIVVGAGPSGATAAYHLALAGVDVVMLEKGELGRDKICGDGLTPRAVRELVAMGVDISEEAGWKRNVGLAVHGGGHDLQLPWPDVPSFPNFGLVRRRTELDALLARHAVNVGATLLTKHTVSGPIIERGKLVGVTARTPDGPATFRAPVVIDAGGVSARLATSLGVEKRNNRPMGVAVRTYFRSPKAASPYMESYLTLWDGAPGESNLLPGYGWVFPLADGTINIGLGSVSSTAKATDVNYRVMLKRWIDAAPPEWELTPDNQDGPIRGAALPMAFNRKPHYRSGLMLIGDAGGMVSPFNGEGIAYGMQAARYAAEAIVQGLARPTPSDRERAFATYARRMARELGGYYNLGRVFVSLIERPAVMAVCTKYGLPMPWLMKLIMKLLSDVYEPHGGDWADRIVSTLARLAPRA